MRDGISSKKNGLFILFTRSTYIMFCQMIARHSAFSRSILTRNDFDTLYIAILVNDNNRRFGVSHHPKQITNK